MFEDSTFASTARRNPRRGWAAVVSFAFQAVVLGIFVLVPLLYTDALPVKDLKGIFVVTAPISHAPMPKAPEVRHTHETASNYVNSELVTPVRIPTAIRHVVDSEPVDSGASFTGPEIPGSIPDGTGHSDDAIRNVLGAMPHAAPSIAPPRTVRLTSGVTEGLLIRKVTPIYPSIARQARIQGPVVLQATIGRDGTIENLHALSGNPWLQQAAIDAVKQWRYKPYLLNNEPVAVETQITVNFTLGG